MTSAAQPERTPREQVLDVLLHADGALDAAEVAERLGVHVTTARFHLDNLTRQDLVRRRSVTTGRRGRPRVLYSPAAGPRGDRSREQLIEVLAAALDGNDSGPERALRAGASWADALAAEQSGAPDAADAQRLIEALEDLGFAPEPGDDGILLRECPFRDAARRHPDVVCTVHRGLVERLAGPGRTAGLVPFVAPDLCLVTLDPAEEQQTR
ncbi:MAG TPA: helix-turn-helix domain-containing protein [Microbacterium sp.]|nr:helix-turn-helix domain-containing protein [Microbacterium sp.]